MVVEIIRLVVMVVLLIGLLMEMVAQEVGQQLPPAMVLPPLLMEVLGKLV
jgi:hypothetical protein